MKLSPAQKAYGFALLTSAMVSAGFVISSVAEQDEYSLTAKKTIIEVANLLTNSALRAMITTVFFTAAGVNFVAEPIFGLFNCCCREETVVDEQRRLLEHDV